MYLYSVNIIEFIVMPYKGVSKTKTSSIPKLYYAGIKVETSLDSWSFYE